MLIKKTLLLFVFICFLFNCKEKEIQLRDIQIIPTPSEYQMSKGNFVFDKNTGINFDEGFSVSASFLKEFIEKGSGLKLKSNTNISFIKDESITNNEGYLLQILPNKIEIKASTDQGAFYAVQTLRQLLPESFENSTFSGKEVAIQCVTISDNPQFKYRGMHLDVGRHLYSVAFIKKYIDALAMLKMNTFHWHLTEDQGWRIEIKKYPKLNEIAAFRNETLIGHYNDQPHQFDGEKYGGYYTQEQIKDIVAYAQKRHVTIIPEIEMPGHSQAAIAAYPELGCTGNQVEVAKKWGIFEEIYCTKDETFNFIEDVLDEVLELFPSTYIHIGGDEAPKTRWKNCNDCQNRIKTEGLKDEHELQNYFITRIEKYLNSKGRKIIGWDEILEGGLAPNATVMSWRGMQGAIDAAKQKHNVILTPGSHCYFDHYQSIDENEPLAIGGFLPLEKVYSFNPIPDELTKAESQYVLGAQGNVWTEYMPTSKQVEYMAFPRMLAMSEVVWSQNKNKDYDDFVSRLENFHKRLDALDINYANHLYEIEGELVSNGKALSYQLTKIPKNSSIVYSTDGNNPTFLLYPEYENPIVVDTSMIIKAAVFNSRGKQLSSVFMQELNYHKAVGKNITLNVEPNKAYSGSGKQGLINGISGSDKRYGDKEWLGFSGDDVEITIDLGEETKINSIEMRFHNGNGQWIYAPKFVEISFNNGVFEKHQLKNSEDLIINFKLELSKSKVETIQIKIPNYGIIPDGKQGAGHKAWTFIDEIIVN